MDGNDERTNQTNVSEGGKPMRPERVYISGPISGIERETYMAQFAEAERLLRDAGYDRIVNPTRFWVCKWPWLYRIVGYRLTLAYDLWRLWRCQRIFLLPNWQNSTGSCIESFSAHKMGLYRLPFNQREILEKKMEKFVAQQSKSLKPDNHDTTGTESSGQ